MTTNGRWRRLAKRAAVCTATALAPAPLMAQTPPTAPVAHFDVRAIQVVHNTLLPPAQVETVIYPFMGPGKTAADIESARAALQKAFEEKGYSTVSVFIPEQSVESGIIRLEVQAQAIGTVQVAGGKRTSKDWVLKRAPSLTAGAIPNFTDVQRDVVALNQSADRKVTPEVKAGVAPGTVDVTLNVEDKSPFHASAEINDYNSASTTGLRVSGTVRYDDLWGRGDSISVSAQTAPQRTSDGTVFSTNYLARLGRVQLLGYFVHSDSDIAVVGGTSVIGKGDLGGVRLIVPLSQSEGFYQSLTAGIDYKHFLEDLRLGATRSAIPITYYPVTLSWRGDWTGERLSGNLALTGVLGTRGLGTPGGDSLDGCVVDVNHFDCKRLKSEPDFFIFKGDGELTAELPRGLQFHAHVSGQWSPDPLISNEGFSLGGQETVRGYFESEALADYGFAYQGEVRSPELAKLIGGPVDALRVHGFLDAGIGGLHIPLEDQDDDFRLASVGGGLRLRVFKFYNGSLDVGVPLIDGPNKNAGSVFARFRIWGEF